jgi:hypothetical protein
VLKSCSFLLAQYSIWGDTACWYQVSERTIHEAVRKGKNGSVRCERVPYDDYFEVVLSTHQKSEHIAELFLVVRWVGQFVGGDFETHIAQTALDFVRFENRVAVPRFLMTKRRW